MITGPPRDQVSPDLELRLGDPVAEAPDEPPATTPRLRHVHSTGPDAIVPGPPGHYRRAHLPVEKSQKAPEFGQQSAAATQFSPASPQQAVSLLALQRRFPQHPQLLPHGPWALEQQYAPLCKQAFGTSSQARSPQHWRELVQDARRSLHRCFFFRRRRFFCFAAMGSRPDNPAPASTATVASASRREPPDARNLAAASNRSPSMARTPALPAVSVGGGGGGRAHASPCHA